MKTIEEMAAMAAGIWAHYEHACRKHPKCTDTVCHRRDDYGQDAEREKAVLKQMVASGRKDIPADLVLDAELNEIYDAVSGGDIAQARYEILDAIAVLMRMDDMLAGEEKGEVQDGR